MNVEELGKRTREIDTLIYNLASEYLCNGMDAAAMRQYERWFDFKRIDVFNKSMQEKKEFYEKG